MLMMLSVIAWVRAAEKPYTVVFRGRRLGLQLRELHDIPVVGGLQGYDPDGTQDGKGEDGEARILYFHVFSFRAL